MIKEEMYREEQEHLEKSLSGIDSEIKFNETKLDEQRHTIIGVKEAQRGAHFTREAMMTMYATAAERLKRARKSPYFGRFDFNSKGQTKNIYVGKASIRNELGDLVYDWRTPICSLYYEDGFGKKSYEAPSGTVTGEILGKRQIKIDNANLITVADASSLSSDDFLIPFLKSNADSRLKDIVSSIQSEQNTIIRDKIKDNIVVQGVAGSGKTTVALHRIAYLLYTYRNINDNQVLIIGPNDCFMNYISDVLPDLDVEKITQKTYMNLVEEIIGKKVSLEDQNITIENVMNKKINVENSKFKTTLDYEKMLESFLTNYFKNFYTKDLNIVGIQLINKNRVNEFYDVNSSNPKIFDRINYFAKITKKDIIDEKSEIKSQIWQVYRDSYMKLDKNDPKRKQILEKVDYLGKEIDKGCSNLVDEYLKLKELNPIFIYKKFMEYISNLGDEKLSKISEESMKYLSKNKIRYEDLAAILLISIKLYDIKDFKNYAHVVIDEAQDYNLFQFDILKKIFNNCTFSIFGDLNQSIYSYNSIENWETICSEVFKNECKYGELNKSYRTTKEIIDLSNFILDCLERQNALSVLRHGDKPKFIDSKKCDDKDIGKDIINTINVLLEKGNKSIAIITKNEKRAKALHKKLSEIDSRISLITSKDKTYNSGICIIPGYLSKGLEFDAVIIENASEKEYSSNSPMDMKLLYVSTTRPLHNLVLYHDNDLTKPMKNYIKSMNNK